MINATQEHLTYVAGLLIEYRNIKNDLEDLKLELRRAAFDCGLPQEDIPKVVLTDFLDGYLVAHGVIQNHRR